MAEKVAGLAIERELRRARSERRWVDADAIVLESEHADAKTTEAAIAAIDGAYVAVSGIALSIMPIARVVFMQAVEAAWRGDDTAGHAIQLFRVKHPELAAKLSADDVQPAIDAWKATDGTKWPALRAAIRKFDPALVLACAERVAAVKAGRSHLSV